MYSGEKHRIKNYKDLVSTYYAVISEPYRQFWGDFFHPAIFEDEQDDIDTALYKTHQRFLRDAQLRPEDRVVDLGCGIGSLACLIASEVGCSVVGVNLSEFQLRKARTLAKKQGVRNVTFQALDIMDIDKSQEKFNAAFLIDVGCHLPDKEKMLRNIFSILKKQGRLVMADWIQKESLNSFEKELLIEPFNEYWNFPYMESVEGYKKLFHKTGFTVLRAEDVSRQTQKNWDMFYDIALREINAMTLSKMVRYIKNPAIVRRGGRAVRVAKNQFYANIFTKVCFDAGVARYGYFTVKK